MKEYINHSKHNEGTGIRITGEEPFTFVDWNCNNYVTTYRLNKFIAGLGKIIFKYWVKE